MKSALVHSMIGIPPEFLISVCHHLKSYGIEPVFCNEKILNYMPDSKLLPKIEAIISSDIIIALGGDGTIIHAAKRAAFYGKMVLGINCGHLGFTAGLESNELTLLERLQTGKYNVDERMCLKVTLEEGTSLKEFYCLNDAVISKGALSRIINIHVEFSGGGEMNYRSDGLILSTPTGSTAYSLSAGGPVLDPSISGILMTPICVHSFFARPVVLNSESSVKVKSRSRSGSESYLTIDGEEAIKLAEDAVITIRKEPNLTAKLIKIKADSFVHVLNRKLIERGRGI